MTLPSLRLQVSSESLALIFIASLDLVSSLFWLSHRMMTEGNPIMAWAWGQGICMFVSVKFLSMALPLTFVERVARPHSPDFSRKALRVGAGLYFTALTLGMLAYFLV